jgi:hypothetical protein
MHRGVRGSPNNNILHISAVIVVHEVVLGKVTSWLQNGGKALLETLDRLSVSRRCAFCFLGGFPSLNVSVAFEYTLF